ncbi:DUF6212 domain-containing protein [Paracoccus nototheniae]|uniref:DUF6212 domain-containing protein n=1 Tax=Paracoccus nototheniae TaxID=2489002 RepID=UPI00103F8726|nr:DUF6212 domain-containing protein [Paracoccus nototheniae]
MFPIISPYSISVDRALDPLCRDLLPPALVALLTVSDVPAPQPGQVCLAVLVAPDAVAAAEARLAEQGLVGVPVIAVDSGRPGELADRLSGLLVARLHRVEREAGDSRTAAAMLRRENTAIVTRFREIEGFLHSLGNPQISRSLTWEPVGRVCILPPQGSLLQHLPVSIVNISAIDLWLPEVSRAQQADLKAALVDGAGRTHPLIVTQDDLKLGTGWVRLAMDAAVQGDARDCALTLKNGGTSALVVGMGMRTPVTRFAASGEGMPGDQVVALRAWKALAGVMLPETGTAIGAGEMPRDMLPRFLSPSSLPRPEIFAMPHAAPDYITGDFWENEDAVIVHPSRSGPVCAIIRDVPLRGLRQLTAVVTVGHPRAPNLNFAIGVTPHGALGRDGYWEGCLGPWLHALPARGWAQVHCVPQMPIDRADIYLAASLAQDLPNDLSWALFRGFRVVTDAAGAEDRMALHDAGPS